MFTQSINWNYQWGQIVGRAWGDRAFSQRLLADPVSVLSEYDVAPPAGLRVRVLEETEPLPQGEEGVMHLILPNKPSAAELSDEELSSAGTAVAAARCGCGGCHGCGGCGGCWACIWCYYQAPPPDVC